MDKFDKVKFFKTLSTLPFPVAHDIFLTSQQAPYMIYNDNDFAITAANSKSIRMTTHITLELYTDKDTDDVEEVVEILLNDFTTFSKARTYIDEEKLQLTYYEFDL